MLIAPVSASQQTSCPSADSAMSSFDVPGRNVPPFSQTACGDGCDLAEWGFERVRGGGERTHVQRIYGPGARSAVLAAECVEDVGFSRAWIFDDGFACLAGAVVAADMLVFDGCGLCCWW